MKYTVIYMTAGGSMASGWSGPYRKEFDAFNDAAAIEKAREIDRNWSNVIALFPSDAEIKYKTKSP